MKSPGEFIVNILEKDGQISIEQVPFYIYLFNYIGEELASTFLLFVLGLLAGRIKITFCYLFTALPIRQYAGGYHAPTKFACSLLTYGQFSLFLLITPPMSLNPHTPCIFFYLICWAIILIIAPVDTRNKRLSSSQKKILRHHCFVIYLYTSIVILYFLWTKQYLYYTSITICVILDTVGLLLGIWTNRGEL